MKRGNELETAANFYNFYAGHKPVTIGTLPWGSDNDRVRLMATDYDKERDSELIYEIEINYKTDSIIIKEIFGRFTASHFMQGTKQISELRQGDQFRLSGDCLVYEFCGSEFRFGCTRYMVRPTTGRGTQWISADVEVWPCK